jgi:hypothetical protein
MSTITREDTQSTSKTIVNSAKPVQEVMDLLYTETTSLTKMAPYIKVDYDPKAVLAAAASFALNQVVSAFVLQFYVGEKLVREYKFTIIDGDVTADGPAADNPPTGPVPPNTHVRLVACPNPDCDPEKREFFFREYGWSTAKPLSMPDGIPFQKYGTHASGDFGLTREFRVNPEFAPCPRSEEFAPTKGGA